MNQRLDRKTISALAIKYYLRYLDKRYFVSDRILQEQIDLDELRPSKTISYNAVFLIILFRRINSFIKEGFPVGYVPQDKLMSLAEARFTELEIQALLLIRAIINEQRGFQKDQVAVFPALAIQELRDLDTERKYGQDWYTNQKKVS